MDEQKQPDESPSSTEPASETVTETNTTAQDANETKEGQTEASD